ncbi:MAG: hypothetical protein LC796_12770 [Acidobacteria bacterium]|nr:hypothetical protein [Acidobacteriota bacterium]MCA1611559.1 hypothetical protein [Acidobacteriota bacterium]
MSSRIFQFTAAGAILAAAITSGCQKSPGTGAETAGPGPSATAVAGATPASATARPDGTRQITTTTTTTTVTVDPVEASQHNAVRRRARATSGKTGSDVTTTRSGEAAGASDARRSTAGRREHEVPAGTILRARFDKTISTATAREGEVYSGELLDDLLADDDTVVAPSGTRVHGKVEHVVDSGKLARPAELRFRLTDLDVNRRTIAIATSAYERVGDTHTKRNAGYIAGGAAVGAILGQVLGGNTKGTVEGAAAGAAAGTGVAALGGDLDFSIEAGRSTAFTLEQPLRLPAAM